LGLESCSIPLAIRGRLVQIQKKVAEHFDVRIADMTGKRRTANFAFPRQVATYLAVRHTKRPF
jgi:chromosomal replication initiation ATPase DnaA